MTYIIKIGRLTIEIWAMNATEAVEQAKKRAGNWPAHIVGVRKSA